MKAPSTISVSNTLPKSFTPELKTVQKSAGSPFSEILDKLQFDSLEGLSGGISEQIVSGKKISAQQLLSYQMKVSRFGLKIELSSKVAEAATGTLRKLESTSQ